MKKVFQDMDINYILSQHNIDLNSLKENPEDELLRLEPFDDTEYEQRTPSDYLNEVLDGQKEGV